MKQNKPINIFQAINDSYTSKQNKFMSIVSEMEKLALAQLNEAENDFVKHLTNAMLETIVSIGKAYITIYEVEPVKKQQENQVVDGNA